MVPSLTSAMETKTRAMTQNVKILGTILPLSKDGRNVSTSTILETAYAVDTPEGGSLELSPAGGGVRGLAFGIDFLLRVVIYVVVVGNWKIRRRTVSFDVVLTGVVLSDNF